ncbi:MULTISPECIES: hypothetical protein [Providencia]|uniref:hypothetical protein n=1 Tax=Providencia TaxID=586 RepID=UPI001ADBE241|nr:MULTISPECIES: hypothetical protein [Providencia]MBO8254868.1 hypothetical protein [Providencia rettgeri]MBO8259054.1 hypothetical protein [Providencia rettgeri]MDE4731185.1 hypothetical protein [Providencia rettgeri]
MNKSKQQFEEWFNYNGISAGWCSKRDLEFIKNKMYHCWKASRESLINNLDPVGYMRLEGSDNIKEYGFTHIYEEKFDKETIPLYRLDK